ncbi:MAG: GatB/YqeY domain-containing protein [Flavobacteriales bacterium]|nr:MAG: GatB/YqeY domain-containing protein [Flavobacteriales bacterium TMED96]RZP12141.1 MAG: GatB/YqeY domain-containing protein [Flavobacteriales bacterium]|tara:strand:+ start:7339 stop:7791 length:453 start_codon:yes stop_codon:yes gene_type:complete
MLLIEKINIELKQAMLIKDKLRLESLRAIKTSLTLHQSSISSNNSVTKEDEIKILQKLVKQRRESTKIYIDQNRPDLAQIEEAQADFISTFLPEQLTNQEIEAIVSKVIKESKSIGLKDMGKVIGIVVKMIEGRADGKTVSNIVKQKLSD